MKIAFSWDDGALNDVRLFELHRKYQIPGMFFVPTKNFEGRKVLTPDLIRDNVDEIISFGGHTQNHIYLTKLSAKEAEDEIAGNKKYLEDILQKEIRHFCFPGGKYNPEIKQMAGRHFQTLRTADTMCFGKPEKGMLRPSFHFYPRGIKSLIGNGLRNKSYGEAAYVIRKSNLNYFDLIKSVIEMDANKDKRVSVWGHSWEIEELGLWKELESLFQFVRGSHWGEVADYNEMF